MFFGPSSPEMRADRHAREAEARALCSACPHELDCLVRALERNEAHGIWGGMTPEERRELRALLITEGAA